MVVTPPYQTHVLKVWLPLPPSDEAQQVSGSRLSSFPMDVEPRIAMEKKFGNRFAYFEFHDPKGAQIIRHRFSAKIWQLDWSLNPAKIETAAQWSCSFDPYLQQNDKLNQDLQFKAVMDDILSRSGNGTSQLLEAMQWIDAHMTYDHANSSLRADADFAFLQRRGHCSDYHGLCSLMGRSLGYPTRVTYGLAMFPKNSPSHCKMEAYLPPLGWVSFDLSETQKLVKQIAEDESLTQQSKEQLEQAARERLFRGFRENSWLLMTRGTDYELAPPASQKVRVVRTIYAEADGEALPDPDPANLEKREFAWMTVHDYKSNKKVTYPFKDLKSLEPLLEEK